MREGRTKVVTPVAKAAGRLEVPCFARPASVPQSQAKVRGTLVLYTCIYSKYHPRKKNESQAKAKHI
jgi:hypothetical protein